MPTYEYECPGCGSFDFFQSMSDAPLESCPTCGNRVRRKINGGTGVIFKGSGFYKNDSKKGSSAQKASSDSGSKPTPACESCAAAASCPAPAKESSD